MTISERIILLIEEKNLTLSQFANILNVTPSYISKIKNNPDAVPSDRTITDICNKFHVKETWLRTGEGEMFQEKTREVEIAEMTAEMAGSDPTDLKYQFMKLLAEMTPEQIHMFKELGEQLQKNMQEAKEKADK